MNKLLKLEGYDLLSKKVYRILKKEIIKGSFKPGDKVLEGRIAEQMGISRTPVREAIRELAAEGFVTLSPNQGVVVRSVSAESIREVLQIHSVLEGLAARLSCEVINEEDLKELENYVNKMEKLANKKDSSAYSEVDLKFHELIVNICRNKRLIQMRKNISDQAQRYRISSLSIPRRLKESLKEHQKILDAFKVKDPKKADSMSQKHIQNALKNILVKVIEKQENSHKVA
ncbi:MAG: GntR family transcriptional regulator [Atribacterota bacterium]